jgi:hypothetical protein
VHLVGEHKTFRKLKFTPLINKKNLNENSIQIQISYKNNGTQILTLPVTFHTSKNNEYMQNCCIFFGLCVAGIVEEET